MTIKFVIITMQRSGSNMLVHLLNEHPQIACFGELMRPTPKWMLKNGYHGALRYIEKVDPKFKDDKVRIANPYEFVESVFALNNGRKSVLGFKLHIGQHDKFLIKLINDPEYALIFLYRDNTLAKYSSQLIAEATGQGSAKNGRKINKVKVKFDRKDFLKFVNQSEKELNNTRKEIIQAGSKVLEISYLDLAKQDKLAELIKYLGANEEIIPEPVTVKRNSSNIFERFTNKNLVLKVLKEIGHEDWSYENSDHGN